MQRFISSYWSSQNGRLRCDCSIQLFIQSIAMHDAIQDVSSHPSSEMDDAVGKNTDESTLIALGHKPELKRMHTFWSCSYISKRKGGESLLIFGGAVMAYQTTILCSWSCNIVMFYYVFSLGGPVSLVWGTSFFPSSPHSPCNLLTKFQSHCIDRSTLGHGISSRILEHLANSRRSAVLHTSCCSGKPPTIPIVRCGVVCACW